MSAGTVEALAIQMGDCFDNSGPGADAVEQVHVIPCGELHHFEVFYTFALTEGPYPGAEAIKAQWMAGCVPEFEPFVSSAFADSALDISAIYPTQQTWENLDDREVVCSVTTVDGTPRSGSARGSGV